LTNNITTIKARVSCVQKNLFTLIPVNEDNQKLNEEEIKGKLKGKFFNLGLEPPVVGDYVKVKLNEYGDALIDEVLPRTTLFTRPDRSGHGEGFVKNLINEALVANFDYVFIVTSLNQDYSENRIARYVSITLQTGAKPVVILSKADLCHDVELKVEITKAVYDKTDVIAISSKTGYGIDNLKPYLTDNKTIAFIGSSGVGKSTLLNTLNKTPVMKVNQIRDEDGKGRHTTTYRQLFQLDCGVWIMDTPGLREIGVLDVDYGIEQTFDDITSLFSECRFNNCTHTQEPGCAVIKALQEGTLSQDRWEMYHKLNSENQWGKQKMIQIAKYNKQLQKDRYNHWDM